jgi:hypothetical protein
VKTTLKGVAGFALAIFIIIAFAQMANACHYVVGDINGDGVFDGMDVVYAVRYYDGIPNPPDSCECPPGSGHFWYVAGDVNGSCNFNGLDVTFMVSYFKGGPLPQPCQYCPPEQ